MGKKKYQEVPELQEAMEMLEKGKFKKMVAFSYSEIGKKVRTNNHVERTNRKIRFAEKVRYKWRQRKWVLRYVSVKVLFGILSIIDIAHTIAGFII